MSKLLDETIESKLEKVNEMSPTDEGYETEIKAVCNLIDAQTKVDNKESKWIKVGKFALAVIGAISPFAINAYNNAKDDQRLDKTFEYEKTGTIMSTGGRHTLNSILKFKH